LRRAGKRFAVVTYDFLSIHNASDNSVDDYVNFGGSFEDPWAFDGVAWSPDNKRLIAWTYDAFFLVDLEGGDILFLDVPEGVTEGTWSPSGVRYAVALADGRVLVFNYAANTFELEFKAHDVATTIDWSHDQQFLATGGEVPRLAVWRLDY
jgi:WD40 repeat protein